MTAEDVALASVRTGARNGWTLAMQRRHYERMLANARRHLEAISWLEAKAPPTPESSDT